MSTFFMKMRCFILLIAAYTIFGFCEEPCKTFIYGLDLVRPTGVPATPVRYYVDCALLNQSPAWNTREKFPLNLGSESQRAALFIAAKKNVNSNLDLQMVVIQKCHLPENIYLSDKSQAQRSNSNRWFIVFTFSTETIGDYYTAVVLLNKSYAEERTASRHESDIMKSTPVEMNEENVGETNVATPFLEALHSTNFAIPSVQWDPSEGGFPVILESLVETGASGLANKYGLAPSQMELQQMNFTRFVPEEALITAGINVADNLHHWICAMKFTDERGGHEYMTYLLLDHTILQMNRLR